MNSNESAHPTRTPIGLTRSGKPRNDSLLRDFA